MRIADVGSGYEIGFYALLTVYLIGMAGLATRGMLLRRAAGREAAKMGGSDASAAAQMQYHFLAGASFPAWVVFLNYCASYIGGIVMVAVPDDSRALGYVNFFWIAGCNCGGNMFNICHPRIREIMRARNYVSPNDYMTDRYNNVLITALGVIGSTFQMLMFTGLEWLALKHIMVAVTGNETSAKGWVWFYGMFVFGCECLGGMASVALTDAIQAGLLLFSFIMMPFLLQHHYGGYEGINGMDCKHKEVVNMLGGLAASPYGVFATDNCYKNSLEDVGDGTYGTKCAVQLMPDDKPKIMAPYSFMHYALGDSSIPPWLNVDYTFSGSATGKNGVGELESCCALTVNGTCAEGANVCPADGVRYVTSTNNVGFANSSDPFQVNGDVVTTTHNEVVFANGAYSIQSVTKTAAWANISYPGKLEFPDGTWGYTSLKMAQIQGGCVGNSMHNWWQYKRPPKELVYLMFSFGFSWLPFNMSPITLHRVMIAESAEALRNATTLLHLFPICFFLPVILLGCSAGAIWPADSTSAFALVAFKLAQESTFGAVVSCTCLVSCMASFMSTSDSMVIAASLLFTQDFYFNILTKGTASITSIMIWSKCTSFSMIVTGICMALYSDVDFLGMLMFGNGILGVLLIVYMGAICHSLRAPEVLMGMIINVIVVITFQMIRMMPVVDNCAQCEIDGNPYGGKSRYGPGLPPPLGAGDPDEDYLWLIPPFWGTIVSIPATFVCWMFLTVFDPEHKVDAWMQRNLGFSDEVLDAFGPDRMHDDPEGRIVGKIMTRINEPLTTRSAWPFMIFPFFTWIALPWDWWGDDLAPTTTVEGFPQWAYRYLFVTVFGTGCMMYTCHNFWSTKYDQDSDYDHRKPSLVSHALKQQRPSRDEGDTVNRKASFFGTAVTPVEPAALPAHSTGTAAVQPVDDLEITEFST